MESLAVYLIRISVFISIPAALASGSKQNGIDIAIDDPRRSEFRELQSGDVITPPEFLPLAKRLMAKVDNIKVGEGNGIVSSAKSAETLADILFARFFMKVRNIAVLTKYDIAGLDALQALALEGDGIYDKMKLVSVEGGRCYIDKYANDGIQRNMCYKRGRQPRKSLFRLLRKRVVNSGNLENNTLSRRKRESEDKEIPKSRVKMQNKLQKKRHLVVQSRRQVTRSNDTKKARRGTKHKGTRSKNKTKTKKQLNKVSGHTAKTSNKKAASSKPVKGKQSYSNVATVKPALLEKTEKLKGCRWNFDCVNQGDLDSCRLKTSCPGKEPKLNPKSPEAQQEQARRRVRRMIRISSVDEEVEKIIEARVVRLQRLVRRSSEFPDTMSEYISRGLRRKVLNKQGLSRMEAKELNKNRQHNWDYAIG